jgi:hypothetical protein
MIMMVFFCTILVLTPSVLANTSQSHSTAITTIDDTYSIEEKITLTQTESIIEFFVQSDIKDLSVIINNTDIEFNKISDNLYQVNYSAGLDKEKTIVTISYSYPKKTTLEYSKEFLSNTSIFSITLDNQNIASYENIKTGTTILIHLPEEQDTSKSLNLFSTILIGLLVVLLIVTTTYSLRKRGNGEQRNRDVESSELLTTEKALLMNVLKEIEKKHRDKKISDETYEKLKSHYKQQTVDIMSSLED